MAVAPLGNRVVNVRSPDMSGLPTEEYHPGLEGVIASETAIANIEGKDGAGGLEYRGYRIEDLAGHVSYEETAFLLLHGDLPDSRAAPRVRRATAAVARHSRAADRAVRANSRATSIPWTFCAARSACWPTSTPTSTRPRPTTPPTCARPSGWLPRWRRRSPFASESPRVCRSFLPATISIMPPISCNMVNGKVPSPTMREAFDISLVLYTEHELNASTFSARVTVSTLSDIYSGIVAAIGTLKGPLHGGANEEAWKLLERVGSPDNAERWIERGPGPQGADHGLWPPRLQDRRSPHRDSQTRTASSWREKSATIAGNESPSRSSGS